MQAYDIIMLIVLAAATLFGMIKGFAWQVASLASIIVSYFVAYNFRDQVATRIHVNPPMNTFIAMLLIYAVTSFAIWVVFRLVSSSIDRVRLRDFDRQMGTAFGFGKGVIYCMLITMFAMTLLGQQQQQAIVASKSGHYISSMLSAAEGVVLPHEIEAVIRPHLDRVKQQLEGGAVATNPSSTPASPWSNELANQVGNLASGILHSQGNQGNNLVPPGYPTSQQITPNAGGNMIEAAQQNLNWPQSTNNYQNNQNSAGQGGWNGSAGAPLPNSNFYPGTQPSQSPSLLPSTGGGNFDQQPAAQGQYNNYSPYR
jgi:membrane protein required for colicin V production